MAAGSLWGRARTLRPFLGRVSYYLIRLLPWVPPVIWINENLGEPTFISGPSMYPFFNDRYNKSLGRDVCWNFKYGARQGLERGMVVTFRSPNDPEKLVVKRIIALGGDVVHTRPPYPARAVSIPPGHMWVEGDARDPEKSLDSNTYGPISDRLVTGRITHILLPLRKAGRVKWWEQRDLDRVQVGQAVDHFPVDWWSD
ncbi:mitochondrial inner membrane protease subunit [Thozetella sp. PMI_491]|nr:mitochondrial inner membrane protease subunit [Thozetella sp. PMI_491]